MATRKKAKALKTKTKRGAKTRGRKTRGGGMKAAARTKASKTKKTAGKRKPNAAFMKALTPSTALADVVGTGPLPRTQAIQKLWAYIKRNNLQNPKNKRNIVADDKLKDLFGKKEVTMFELAKIVNKHLT